MKIIKLLKYQLQTYLKGHTFVMPFAITLIFLFCMYSIQPNDIVSSFLISGTYLFILMAFVGMSIASHEDTVTEQIFILRVQNVKLYYTSKILFIVVISFFFGVLCTLLPTLKNIIAGGALFTRNLTINDIGNALLIQTGSGMLGGVFGNFLHPRVMKDRKMAIILTVFFTILAIVKVSVIQKYPLTKFVLWVLPPALLPTQYFAKAQYFNLSKTLIIFLVFLIYTGIYGLMKSLLCHKNKF